VGKIPSHCKFKPVKNSSNYYFGAGFVSNAHWAVSAAWIASLVSSKETRARGLVATKNAVIKKQAYFAASRLAGNDLTREALVSLVEANQAALKTAKRLDLSRIVYETGYFKGDATKKIETVLTTDQRDAPRLDIEYSALLFFDPTVSVFYTHRNSPVLVAKNGELVAVLMPLQSGRK
jgi:hypothetical protein